MTGTGSAPPGPRRKQDRDRTADQPLTTRFTALGPLPFLSGSTSKLMRCPSLSDFKPARSTAVMCTNTSRPPSSGLMKPYPRSLLKNLTVPVVAIGKLLSPMLLPRRPPRRGGSAGHSQTGKGIGRKEPQSPPPAPYGGGTSKPAPRK